MLQRAYERLGPRYPQRAVVLQIQLGYLVLLLMLAILATYLEMSAGEFLRLFALGVVFFAIHNLLYARVVRRLLLPVVTWLRGERGERQAAAAWRAAAGLPLELLRRDVRRAPLAVPFARPCSALAGGRDKSRSGPVVCDRPPPRDRP